MTPPLRIGVVVFPDMTLLDATGPLQVFAAIPVFAPAPGVELHVIGATLEPVPTDAVLTVAPTTTFADCPPLDILCVPGGPGVDAILDDPATIDFVRRQGAGARWITSVCTGALVLGAAGLLDGYRAATHWAAMGFLEDFGAVPTDERVVIDRDRVTGGGVTAGLDFALTLVAELLGRAVAEAIQLRIEYLPEPPFAAGSPRTAPPEVVADYRQLTVPMQTRRRDAVARAVALLAHR